MSAINATNALPLLPWYVSFSDLKLTESAHSKNPLRPNSTIAVDWMEQLTGSQFSCTSGKKKRVHWMESPRNNSNITFAMCKCWSYSMNMKDTCQSHSDLLVRSNELRELPQHLMIWLRAIFSTNRACRWSLLAEHVCKWPEKPQVDTSRLVWHFE